LNHIKQKHKLYLSTETDLSECYKYYYSIDEGKISEKYGELKGYDTIHKISYEKFDKVERGNKYYIKQLSSDKILMSNLMVKNKSTKYIAKYRATPINNFDYLELRLMFNTTKLIKDKPIQIITHIANNDNINFIDEVEDVKHNINKVKPTKDLTLNIPTNIILDKLNSLNITNIIFNFVGYISPIFKIIPTKCYNNNNKNKILNINKYINTNNNKDIITSTINRNRQDINMYKLNNCIMYEREHKSFESTYIYYEFEISPDLTNTTILNYLIEIDSRRTFNDKVIEFKYNNRTVRGCILNYDIKQHTIKLDRNTEIFNIDSISECILKYDIMHYKNIVEVNVYNRGKSYYYENEESNNKPIEKSKPKHNNDNIDFID
jgi:hypothetical protein